MPESPKALDDVRVADFSWVIAGPLATSALAQYGATVVKVESTQSIDPTRPYAPYKDNKPGVNRGGMFCNYNNCKHSLTLDLKNPRGLDVARKLVAWADVVVESYSPGVMKKLGLDYEAVRQLNADVIMLSTSMFGQSGPTAKYSALGTMLQAASGFVNLWGWPDRDPVAPQTAYTDFIAPSFIVIAIVAALEHRQRTGEGQYIDVAQYETALNFMAPLLLDYAANGTSQQRRGNASAFSSPRGVYRCQGEDRWCAVEVASDEQWEGLVRAMGSPRWADEARFATLPERLNNSQDLDALIETWTVTLSAEEVMARLQANGVPAMRVANNRDLHEDPQLNATGHFPVLVHPEMGETVYDAPSYQLLDTPFQMSPAPCLGEHNDFVCTKLLGMTDEEFIALASEGVFS